MTTSDDYTLFSADVEMIVGDQLTESELMDIVALAWKTSFDSKENRVKAIEEYLNQRGSQVFELDGRTCDLFELIISLAHLRRAKYPS